VEVPKSLKIPPLEQRKKRGYCKYHNFLGHKTSHYVLFRDLVQRGLNEGRLRFGDKAKPHMQVDSDPLKDVNAIHMEVASCNIVETIADVVEKLSTEAKGDVAESRKQTVLGNQRLFTKNQGKQRRWAKLSTTVVKAKVERLIPLLKTMRHKGINELGGTCSGPVRRPTARRHVAELAPP